MNALAKYTWGLLAYNLGVILWGAYVRATGSGAGCGRHWPTCKGQVIPIEPSIQTLIEFSHRFTSGLALITVLVLLVWALKIYPKGHQVRKGAWASVVFMITEGGLGAGLVLFELVAGNASMARVYSMGLHLINTFLLLAAITLTAFWASGGKDFFFKGHGALGRKLYVGFGLVLTIGVTGAVTALGDTLFPPEAIGAGLMADGEGGAYFIKRLRIFHPILAVSLGLYFIFLGLNLRRPRFSAPVRRLAGGLMALYGAQIGIGVVNIFLHVPVWTQLLHLLFADLVWITLVLITAQVFTEGADQNA